MQKSRIFSPYHYLPGPVPDVPDRVTHNPRETSPPRLIPYEANTVALEKQLEGIRITRKGDPHPIST